MNMLKRLLLPLTLLLAATGCVATLEEEPAMADNGNCFVVSDAYGERQVCNTQTYYVGSDLYYWDSYYGIWVGPRGYYRENVFFGGVYPGWYGHYGSFYRGHGYYAGRGWNGGYYNHGGGYHGYGGGHYSHGGGGFHGGGHGGHR